MKPFSRLCLCIWVLLVLVLPAQAATTELKLKSDTIVRNFERETLDREDQIVPVYEYLQLDYANSKAKDMTFHAYGWMRVNLGDDYFDDETEAELLYAFADYRPKGRDYMVRIGRQYVFEGVANENVDGISGSVDINPYLSLSGYTGFPAALDATDGRSGDWLAGGRLSLHKTGKHDLGLSYKYVLSDGDRDEELAGVDLSLSLPGRVTLMGYSTRNLVADRWAEHFYELRFGLGRFEFRPFFQQYQLDGFFLNKDNSSGPFRVISTLDSETRVVGTEAFWYPSEDYEFAVKYKDYDYQERFDSARYYSGVFTYKWDILSHFGLEGGRMEGDQADLRYKMGRAFVYLNLPPGFITGDFMYVDYDEPIFNEDRSVFASLGFGRRMLHDALDLRLSFDYSSDPNFDDDYRGQFVATYTYDR